MADPGDATGTTPDPTGGIGFSNPIAVALMNAGRGGGIGNPQLALLQPNLQYAQALLGQGAQNTPVASPWAAAARAVQGIVGGLGMRQYGQQAETILARQQAQAQALASMPLPGVDNSANTVTTGPAPTPSAAPAQFTQIVANASKESGIPQPVLVGLFHHESSFDPASVNAQSKATGLGQVLPSTAADPGYGLAPISQADLLDPQKNATFSANYLAARGKALYGDKWDPSNVDMMKAALNGYGDGSATYADAVLAKAGVAPPDAATVAANPQLNMPAGMAAGIELQRRAMIAASSGNPFMAAMAPFLSQQANLMMQRGRFAVTKDAAGNLINTDLWTGKPATSVVGPRPEVWNQLTMADLAQKYSQGGIGQLQPNERTLIDQAIVRDYKPETDDKTHIVRWGMDPPQWIKDYYTARGALTPGAAPGAAAVPGAVPAAPGAATGATVAGAGVTTPGGVEMFQKLASDRIDADNKTVAETQDAMRQGEGALANTQTVRNMIMQGANTGWGASWRTDAERVLKQMNATQDQVDSLGQVKDPVSASQVANKIMLGLTMDQARKMGAREASSVIQMFRDAYPNLETDPNATEIMTRMIDSLQYYARDRAQAMGNYQNARINDLGTGKTTYSGYTGLSNFDSQFAKTHDIRTYAAAALALARNQQGGALTPYAGWSGGLNDAQKAQALALAQRMSGGRGLTVNLAHGANVPITPDIVQKGLQGVNAPPDNPDFGL